MTGLVKYCVVIVIAGVAVAQIAGSATDSTKPKEHLATIADAKHNAAGDTIRRSPDGHFYALARVNGAEVRFLIDTGATMVALSPADAARAGIRPDDRDYTGTASTAGGETRIAPVVIDDIELGDRIERNVAAAVIEGYAGISLLGQSYLSRYDAVSIESDDIVLE